MFRVSMAYLRVTIGHPRVTVGHPRVTVGHPRVTVGHLRVTVGGKISSRGAGNVTMAIYISGITQHIQHYKH